MDQEHAKSLDQRDNITRELHNMMTGLVNDTICKGQKNEPVKQPGTTGQDNMSGSVQNAQMDIKDIKQFIGALEKFLNSSKMVVAQLEANDIESYRDDDKLLDDFMDITGIILEIATFGMKDALTGLSNRHALDNRLILEWNRAVRDGSPISLLIFGVDQQDDATLIAISKMLDQEIKRSTDFAARWDNKEFAVLLPNTNAYGAMFVAERVHRGMEALAICATVHIGIGVQMPGEKAPVTDFIDRAHRAYMSAKETGKSTVYSNKKS